MCVILYLSLLDPTFYQQSLPQDRPQTMIQPKTGRHYNRYIPPELILILSFYRLLSRPPLFYLLSLVLFSVISSLCVVLPLDSMYLIFKQIDSSLPLE